MAACRVLPLPMHDYIVNVIGRLSWRKRYLNIYDQLNPAYARYYRRDEPISLLRSAGFTDVQAYHRHAFCWALTARRSAEPSKA